MKKLILVIGIVVICALAVAALILVSYSYIENQGRMGKPEFTERLLGRLDEAISAYSDDTGTLPAKLADLVIVPEVENWNGPYISHTALVDAWNNSLIYAKIEANSYLLISVGANGKLFGDGEDSVLFSPKSGPASNKGFNRTPESSRAAKPVESGGGAG